MDASKFKLDGDIISLLGQMPAMKESLVASLKYSAPTGFLGAGGEKICNPQFGDNFTGTVVDENGNTWADDKRFHAIGTVQFTIKSAFKEATDFAGW